MRPPELWRQKLSPPNASFATVPRSLAGELATAPGLPGVVLVLGPAGFGKTSLLRSVYEARRATGERVVWLSLDAADNDLQHFLEYLGAAMHGAPATPAPSATPTDAASYESVIAGLSQLVASNEQFSVFLDDVQMITDVAVLGILGDLTAAIPGHGTLFLGGRRMPDLQIGRLRAQGEVLEVGVDELRFSAPETEQLLANVAGRRVAPEVAATLHDRTEGWAAVLQLAALMLSKRGDDAEFVGGFSGDSSALGSYLAEEIIAAQPEEVRELMLRSSICERISAELCDAVRDSSGSAALLRDVERDNLCLFRLDGQGHWFRFHDLFADYLRRELHRRHPDQVPVLHRRAANWFAGHDHKAAALEHALASGDTEWAADLADEYAQPLTAAGRLTTLIRAAQPLPRVLLDRRPRLKVYYTICLAAEFQHRTAAPLIEELSAVEMMDSLDPETRGALLFAIPFQMLLQDRFEEALTACDAHLPLLDPGDPQGRSAVLNVRGVCLLHLRRFDEVQPIEAEARRLATGTYGRVYAECLAGMGELAQGNLSHATAIFESALHAALGESSANSAPTALAAACLAEALYEVGRLDRAEELLDRYLATITHLAIPDGVIQAHTHHIRILFRRHGYTEACEAVNRLRRLGYDRDLPRLVATAWAEHSRLALLGGDVAGAERYLRMAEAAGQYATLWDESSATLRARLLAAKGDPAAALEELDAELARLDAESARRQALKLRVVRSLTLRACGRGAEAMRELTACLTEATRENQVRLLVDEGEALAVLLRELLAARTLSGEVRAFVGVLLEQHDAERRDSDPEPDDGQEALSRRELEVLTHIADGLSNQAIADRLIISLPTVKTHVRNIFGKLAAKNRTEAVSSARRHNLLAR